MVGSYLAGRLAGLGLKVTVIDLKAEIGGPVCCTGLISQECVSSFGISNDVILKRFNSARVFSPAGKLIELRRRETQACVVDRGALDLEMVRKAQSNGAEYSVASSVKDVEIKNDGAVLTASCESTVRNIKAEVIVDASGFGSGIGEKLGVGKTVDFVAGAQAVVETDGSDEIEIYLGRKVAPGFFGWLVPTSPRRALVGLLSRRNTRGYLRDLLSSLAAAGKIKSAQADIAIRGIPLQPLPRTYGKRFIVVGSAAGQVKPLTGGGIYYGLLCADIAAGILHSAFEEQDFSAGYLSIYEREWRRKLGREIKRSYWARRVFERLGDRQMGKILEIIRNAGIVDLLLQRPDVTFDWHGDVAMKIMKEKAIAGILTLVRSPFSMGKN